MRVLLIAMSIAAAVAAALFAWPVAPPGVQATYGPATDATSEFTLGPTLSLRNDGLRRVEASSAAPTRASRLDPRDVVARIEAGALQGADAIKTLRRLSDAQLRKLDLGRLLAAPVATGDDDVFLALRQIRLQTRDLTALDRVVLDCATAGTMCGRAVAQYLLATRRGSWPRPQAFLEQGFRRGADARETCALAMARLGTRIPSRYLGWVLKSQELSKTTRLRIETHLTR